MTKDFLSSKDRYAPGFRLENINFVDLANEIADRLKVKFVLAKSGRQGRLGLSKRKRTNKTYLILFGSKGSISETLRVPRLEIAME